MAVAGDKTDCPNEGQLAKYASGVREGADAAEVLAHAERCSRCAHWLADAKDGEAILPNVREALDAETKADGTGMPPPPDFGRLFHARDIEGHVLEEEIGRGGTGEVYRAFQKATKRQVALKILLEGPFASAVTKRRFEREVELAAQLQHPHIVTILESGISSGRYYFAMQYVEGLRLDDYIATSKPSIEQTLQLIGKICEAVNYAHQRGVIHRDLKPSNIIVDSNGDPHVLDFGLAKLADPSTPEHSVPSLVSLAGQLMGTLAYMSPEQATGSNQDIDIRTDVYSLGVILYQALTGRFPYEVVGSVTDVVDNILNIEPARPSKIRAGINDEVETIVLKCLSKERERRYQTAGEVARDIGHYLTGEPIEAKGDSGLYVLKKTLRRYRIPIFIAVGFVVVLTVGLAAIWGLYLRAEAATRVEAEQRRLADEAKEQAEADRSLARRQAYVASITGAHAALKVNEVRAVHRHLEAAPSEFRNWEWQYLYAESHQSLAVLRGHEGPVWSVAYSPDGRLLASGSADKTIRIWDTSTHEARMVTGHEGIVYSVAFDSNGTHLVSASEDTTVRIWDTSTGKLENVLQGPPQECYSAAFHPSDEWLAAGYHGGLRLWDTSSGEERGPLLADQVTVFSVAFTRDGSRLAWGANDKTVDFWNVQDGGQLDELPHADMVRSVAFSPDGSRLASGSFDSTVRVWDVDARPAKELFALNAHGPVVQSVAFSPESKRLASGGDDRTVCIWDVSTGEQLARLRGHEGFVQSVAFSPDGIHLASACRDDKTIRVWDARVGEERVIPREYYVRDMHVRGVAGTRLFGITTESTSIHVRDALTGDDVVFSSFEDSVARLAFSHDGAKLVAASGVGEACVWDVSTGEELTERFSIGERAVPQVAISPDGTMLALGFDDGSVRMMEPSTKDDVAVLSGSACRVVTVAFSPDGASLAIGQEDGSLRVWSVLKGDLTFCHEQAHADRVSRVVFSDDGARLASASEDKSIRIWDASSGAELAELSGHKDGVNLLAFSSDGTRVASGSKDHTVRLWDVASGEELITLREHDARISSIAFSEDGTRLVSVSRDGMVCIRDSVPYRIRYHEREAALAAKRGEFETAEAFFRKAWNGIEEVLGEGHQGALPQLKGFVESLIAQGKFAEAQPLAVQHLERNELAYGKTHTLTVKAALLLVELYDAWDRPDEATRWRAKLPRTHSAADLEQWRSPDPD